LAQLETPFRKNGRRRINKGLPSRNLVTGSQTLCG
jgi:hypothetical protein